MNDARRKILKEALSLITDAKDLLGQAAEEEQEYADNMPENLQGGEKHCAAEEAADKLQECNDELESIKGALAEVIDG